MGEEGKIAEVDERSCPKGGQSQTQPLDRKSVVAEIRAVENAGAARVRGTL